MNDSQNILHSACLVAMTILQVGAASAEEGVVGWPPGIPVLKGLPAAGHQLMDAEINLHGVKLHVGRIATVDMENVGLASLAREIHAELAAPFPLKGVRAFAEEAVIVVDPETGNIISLETGEVLVGCGVSTLCRPVRPGHDNRTFLRLRDMTVLLTGEEPKFKALGDTGAPMLEASFSGMLVVDPLAGVEGDQSGMDEEVNKAEFAGRAIIGRRGISAEIDIRAPVERQVHAETLIDLARDILGDGFAREMIASGILSSVNGTGVIQVYHPASNSLQVID